MKRLKLLLLPILLLLAGTVSAQFVKIKWKQIQTGTTGQVAIVGVDGNGAWVTPPFLNISDTGAMLAAYQTQINARVKYTDTAAMLAAYQAAIALKADDALVVHKAGTENIPGAKTFSGAIAVPTPTVGTHATNKTYVDNLVTTTTGLYIPLTQKGAVNGVAPLDAGGKVDFQYLPATLMIYKGVWNAATNTPTLANGVGTTGWVYKATPGGTVNFGAGPITFAAGDWVIYNGTQWELSNNSDLVVSVNGQQGVVSLTTTNIPEGTNIYFTNGRVWNSLTAGTGIAVNSGTGVITNTAPDQPSNLALGTATTTTRPITNSNGTGVTLPAVTYTAAGLMVSTDKQKLDGIASGAQPGTVTSVTAGAGMDFSAISLTGAVTMGTPSAVTLSSTSSATGTTHSHAFTPGGTTAQYIRGNGTLATFPTQANLQDAAQQFTGSTSNAITLTNSPSAAAHLTVYLNGVALHSADYSVSGTTLTLANITREASDYILVYYSY